MEIFLSVEGKAGRMPDGAQKLRYIRRAIERRKVNRARNRTRLCVILTAALFTILRSTASVPQMSAASYKPLPVPVRALVQPSGPLPHIWVVETQPKYVTYSNGLLVRTDFLTHSAPRNYTVYSRDGLTESAPRSNPAGIVYHTTESLLLPLQEEQAKKLVRTRENALSYVRDGRYYNFVIDRFGQVFRIVPEEEVANHAGHSVWADSTGIYEGLNKSFIGVSFEARTAESIEPTEAQIRSARLLTEYLRSQYAIPESNCVTHAQVSVNPSNMRLGYHTDWAANFPFHDLGLTDGYALPVASIEVFGFEYDDKFLAAIGGHPWDGLIAAEQSLIRNAQSHGMTPRAYRANLQTQYHELRSHL